MEWTGVFPAVTTQFKPDLSIDHEAISRHVRWLSDAGCKGIVVCGSLGEAATLSLDEKSAVLKTCVAALGAQTPVVAGVSALSTKEAVGFAKIAMDVGCQGLMVLPPYVYRGDWREMRGHVEAVIKATPLSCMLYNNPIAYGTDFTPEQIRELCDLPNLHAVKESSADVRRITAIRALVADRLNVFVGVDDLIVEGIQAGAVGWIAGLVNALPKESVALFDLATSGQTKEAGELYRWFLPLLRMDTVPKFIQLIKWVQQEVGMGSARVRPPRLELAGHELEEARRVLHNALKTHRSQ